MEKSKIRVPNFTPSEKLHLMKIIAAKYSSILEDKKTDRASVDKKEHAWVEITSEFNATSSSSIPRSLLSLKKCYENRKKGLRKTLAEEKKEVLLTGGGPPPKKIKTDEVDELLLSIMNRKTLVGLQNPFDDDADESAVIMNQGTECNDIEVILGEGTQASTEGVLNSEEQPILEIGNFSKSTDVSTLTNSNGNWKKYDAHKLQEPINPVLISMETNGHIIKGDVQERIPQSTPKNRRRPTTIVKSLTSSDVAKKYDILLDKRILLVDKQLKHMDEQHVLIMKKRQLEIEILEAQLKASTSKDFK